MSGQCPFDGDELAMRVVTVAHGTLDMISNGARNAPRSLAHAVMIFLRGRWAPGASGNPGGRTRAAATVARMGREQTADGREIVESILAIARSKPGREDEGGRGAERAPQGKPALPARDQQATLPRPGARAPAGAP